MRNIAALPRFTEKQILAWADAYRARTGGWPNAHSGPIEEAPGETWKVVAAALLYGKRGLPGRSSLSQLLAEHRRVWNSHAAPPLSEAQILAWADAHYERTGRWPTLHSGPIVEAPGERWSAVEAALTSGCRGLPGGSSVARLLAARRGVPNPAERPPLTLEQILTWADAHHARTGQWPSRDSGPVDGVTGENWGAIDSALCQGTRGLPGGSSLPRILTEERGMRFNAKAASLSEAQILAWADAHHGRTGEWPGSNSGPILEAAGENWAAVTTALALGYRGLPGGSSVARLLAEHRGVRNVQALLPLTEARILAWADAFHDRTGRWPSALSGRVAEAKGGTWAGVDDYLRRGARGLPSGASLAQLLASRRHARHPLALPALTVAQVLAWADAHHARTGRWPEKTSGPVQGVADEKWSGISEALHRGYRGLGPGSSLARLLDEQRGVRNPKAAPPLTEEQVLAWADAHRGQTGAWPTVRSGPVAAAPGETWTAIETALAQGKRGLPGGSSPARLLAAGRQVRNKRDLPPLTEATILAWADVHHAQTGEWPTPHSGPVAAAPGEQWRALNRALGGGYRGLPGGASLPRLLAAHRGVRNCQDLPALTVEQILAWADAAYQQSGAWPKSDDGPIGEEPAECWTNVDQALRLGLRGLPGGSSLRRLLHARRGVRNRKALPPLTAALILAWADAYQARHGEWPNTRSGPIDEAPGDTWSGVDAALQGAAGGCQAVPRSPACWKNNAA